METVPCLTLRSPGTDCAPATERSLPEDCGIDVPNECRVAWRTFAARSIGWAREDVATWIAQFYRPILQLVDPEGTFGDELVDLDARFLERTVRNARSKLIATVRSQGRRDDSSRSVPMVLTKLFGSPPTL